VRLTRDATQAARLLSIDLLDHVIVGRGRFVSLKERGAL
jgi:DNA repair protein RadC